MADLLAKQESKVLSVSRGQNVEGTIVSILPNEIILDLGTKAEGVIQKKDLSQDEISKLKEGEKLQATVIYAENEFGQVVLTPQRASKSPQGAKFAKFDLALKSNQTLTGRGMEVNKGGLIVEISGMRGFLPASQVSLSQASDLEELIGKDIQVTVIEVDPSQNRLILSQKTEIEEEIKEKINVLKEGTEVEGVVAAVLPFGIFVSLPDKVEGLVHISEMSWEKVEDPNTVYKVGDQIRAKVISKDASTGRVNLSVKKLSEDPFLDLTKGFSPSDVVKGEVSRISPNGVSVTLEGGVEGLVPNSKLDENTKYEVGEQISFLVDNIDTQKRRVNLAPFVTSTKGLIYK